MQHFIRRETPVGEFHGAPLGKPLAGNGGTVAELREQRLDAPLPHDVVVEYLIDDLADVIENVPAVYERLVVLRGACYVEIIAAAAVPLGIYAVERECHLGVDVGAYRGFRPGGVYLAACHVLDVVREGQGDILGVGIRRAEMYGYRFRNDWFGDIRHSAPP